MTLFWFLCFPWLATSLGDLNHEDVGNTDYCFFVISWNRAFVLLCPLQAAKCHICLPASTWCFQPQQALRHPGFWGRTPNQLSLLLVIDAQASVATTAYSCCVTELPWHKLVTCCVYSSDSKEGCKTYLKRGLDFLAFILSSLLLQQSCHQLLSQPV